MLRPLGIGEIFDRAISIYTRNFAVFTLLMLTLFVPFAVLQFLAMPEGSHPIVRAADLFANPAVIAAFALLAIGAPVVNNAIAAGVAAVYSGKQPAYRTSFAAVLPRWPAMLGVQFAAIALMAAAYFAGAVVAVLVIMVGVVLLKVIAPLAVAFIALGAVLVLALILIMFVLGLCCSFAQYGAALEGADVFDAISSAFSRLFDKSDFRKTLLMALVYLGVETGVVIISMTVSRLMLVAFHSTAIQVAVNAAISCVITAFVTVLLAVYYFDVRTRREGLDLEAALQSLPA